MKLFGFFNRKTTDAAPDVWPWEFRDALLEVADLVVATAARRGVELTGGGVEDLVHDGATVEAAGTATATGGRTVRFTATSRREADEADLYWEDPEVTLTAV